MILRDHKIEILITFLGILGLVTFLLLHDKSHPTTSGLLQVSRNDAQNVARRFLEDQGFKLVGYSQTAIYSEDDSAYLQRTLGTDKFVKILPDLPLMYWEVKFSKEHDPAKFVVRVGSKGQIISFKSDIYNNDEGANLNSSQAQALVKAFFEKQTSINLSNYTLDIESLIPNNNMKEKRSSYYFNWKAESPYLGDAHLWLAAYVRGGVIQEFNQRIEYPDNLNSVLELDRSKGNLISDVLAKFTSLFIWAAVVMAVITKKSKTIPWKGVSLLALAIFTVGLLQDINSIPHANPLDDQQLSKSILWSKWFIETVESNLARSVKIFALVISGWIACQKVFKGRMLIQMAGWRDFFSKAFSYPAFIGYVLACIGLGYVTVFYLVGHKYFGIWSPVGSGYSGILNTYIPFLDPLTNAFKASVIEELLFRFFAISFLIKYFRSSLLAIFIPALIWGFGHSDYYVLPYYTKGIELTIGGVIDGYFFIRYGLIAVIVAHFIYDAVIGLIPLLHSSISYYYWSGAAIVGVITIPLLLAIIRVIKRSSLPHPKESIPNQFRSELQKGLIDGSRIPH